MPTLEWNFNLGTIIPLIFAAGIFYAVTKADMKTLKENIIEIKGSLAKQTEIIMQLAVQKERLDNQSKQINQLRDEITLLRRGEGYIQTRKTIDGEYQ